MFPDIMHTNTLKVLDGEAEHLLPAFKAGNILVSMRELHMIAVLDLAEEKFVWHLASGGPLGVDGRISRLSFRSQHDPKILPNGNMLLFDNFSLLPQSTIWEFNPATQEVCVVLSWRQQAPVLFGLLRSDAALAERQHADHGFGQRSSL